MDRKRNISLFSSLFSSLPPSLLPSLLLSSLWLFSLALASGSARAAPTAARYTVAEIGGRGTDGLAINGLGNIAGVVRDGDLPQAFLYANGAFTRLGTLGGAESSGAGVNDGCISAAWAKSGWRAAWRCGCIGATRTTRTERTERTEHHRSSG